MATDDDVNDGIIGCFPSVVDPSHVQELQYLTENLKNLFSGKNADDEYQIEAAFLRFCRILGLYQEQPNLLDGIIPKLIEILVENVKLLNKKDEIIDNLSREALKYMSELFIVRGKKAIVRLLPHQVSLLEPLLVTLEFYSTSSSFSDHSQRNVLLLWLWIVVRNPFDLRRFDPTGDPNNVITRVLNIAMSYMELDWNTSQYSASLVIAQCLSRTDGISRVPVYLKQLLENITIHQKNQKLLLADLLLILAILKHVDRNVLVKHVEEIFEKVSFLYPIDKQYGSLICKCLVKMVQRICLIALKPRNCQWRYGRGKRLLNEMLNEKIEKKEMEEEEDEKGKEEDEEEEIEYVEIVEWSIQNVFSSLSHPDTSLRWSAAKGIGRITSRIPNVDLALQVVDSIINEYFDENLSFSSWNCHGACLAIAELSRRGVLLPKLLKKVIPEVEKLIEFEDLLGRPQMGNQVRDAACYVIWAFSRTYELSVMQPYLQRLANALMCCALFDREVNLRRAASAAFQEMVGRQKGVANGIELLTLVDYFAVTNRQRCFSEICVEVAKFDEYTASILNHLRRKKIVHWDEKIREQSALALEKICEKSEKPEIFVEMVKEILEESVKQQQTPIVRHGFLLTIGHSVKGLIENKVKLEENIISQIIKIPSILKSQTDRSSQTGALIRKAMCNFMLNIAKSGIRLKSDENLMKIEWTERLLTFLTDNSEIIRNLAKLTMEQFVEKYLKNDKEKIENLKNIGMLKLKNGGTEHERIGMCMLFEAIPSEFFSENVFEALSETILKPTKTNCDWALARQHAIFAINKFGVKSTNDEFMKIAGSKCFETFYHSVMDYTTTTKGDIGRYVRQSSMCAMTDILLNGNVDDKFLDEHIPKCTKVMIQQSAERIGRTRECASECLKQLIECEKTGKRMKHLEKLRKIYENSHDFILDSTIFRLKTLLIPDDFYYENVLLGIIISAGGLGEGTQKTAKQILLDHQREINNEKQIFDVFLKTLLKLLKNHHKKGNITMSFMNIFAQIFGNLGIYEEKPEESESIKELVEIMLEMVKKSKVFNRKLLGIEAMAEFLSCEKNGEIYGIAKKLFLESLSSSIPTLRKLAAEKLYEHMCCAEEIDEKILELLSTTNWQEEEEEDEFKQIVEEISKKL